MVSKFLIVLIFFSSYCFIAGLSQDMAGLQDALKKAGGNPPSCLQSIVPCQAYLKSETKPPPECCGPLLDAMKKDLDCLCKLFENEQVLKSVNVTREDALKLPSRCDKNVDTSACDKIKDKASPDMAPGSSESESSSPPSGSSESGSANASESAPPPSESRANKMFHFAGLSFIALVAIFISAV